MKGWGKQFAHPFSLAFLSKNNYNVVKYERRQIFMIIEIMVAAWRRYESD